MNNVVIIDYGMGNTSSVLKTLKKIGANVILSRDAEVIYDSDKIILPGVGHFSKGMDNLKNFGLIEILNESVNTKGIPILGICLGMQLFADFSEEGDTSGLGWIKGTVRKFEIDNTRFKIPHMGWNTISKVKNSPLFENISPIDQFYFVHSYYFKPVNQWNCLSFTEYLIDFTSTVINNNIFGVQFHPEKSHLAGQQLLRNFISL